MLASTLVLGEVDDVEAVARRALADGDAGFIPEADREDALAFVIAGVWVAFERRRKRGQDFPAALAFSVARRARVDWLRQRHGRTRWQFAGRVHERERATLVQLEERDGAAADAGLDAALAGVALDGEARSDPSFDRMLAAGDRPPPCVKRQAGRAAAR